MLGGGFRDPLFFVKVADHFIRLSFYNACPVTLQPYHVFNRLFGLYHHRIVFFLVHQALSVLSTFLYFFPDAGIVSSHTVPPLMYVYPDTGASMCC